MQRDSFIPVDDIFSMSTEMKNGYQKKKEKKIAIWIMQNIMLTFSHPSIPSKIKF